MYDSRSAISYHAWVHGNTDVRVLFKVNEWMPDISNISVANQPLPLRSFAYLSIFEKEIKGYDLGPMWGWIEANLDPFVLWPRAREDPTSSSPEITTMSFQFVSQSAIIP